MPFKFILLVVAFCFNSLALPVWIDMSESPEDFEESITQSDALTMKDHLLRDFDLKKIDQAHLLSKTEFWSSQKLSSRKLEKELQELGRNNVFSASNRLILFEFLKQISDTDGVIFQHLCSLYANDPNLKASEPFFESSCSINRISLKELNSKLAQYDSMLIDGNIVDIKRSPYFYSSGSSHEFKFISNRYVTFEKSGPATSLQKTDVPLKKWVEGTCDSIELSRLQSDVNVHAYFSKKCISEVTNSSSAGGGFLNRNKYYILSGLILAFALSSASTQYELASTH